MGLRGSYSWRNCTIFFGSATNFGVQTFLILNLSRATGHKKTDGEIMNPHDKDSPDLLKSKPTWTLVTVLLSPLSYRINWVQRSMMSTFSASKEISKLVSTQFMAESRSLLMP